MHHGLAAVLAVLICGPAYGGAAATAKLIGSDGAELGRANFRTAAHGVLIEIAAKGLPPGPHAVLIHSSAECNPATGFASAGPVFSFDPDRMHGYFAKGGPRAGDLPVQFAAADGSLHTTLYTTALSLGDGAKSIFDRDGASLIIHAQSDDYVSQPDGQAGARLACGTITRTIGPREKHRRR